MFYYSEIELYETTEGYTDDMGIYQPGQDSYLKTILCDVQPYSRDRFYRDYGYDEEVKFRVFSDPCPDVNTGNIAVYKGDNYKIIRVLEWDDYYVWAINDND